MNNKHWWFIGGALVATLAIIILCVAAAIGGLTSYFLFGKQTMGSRQTTTTINAHQGWQSTGVLVTSGMKISISVISGEWTYWPDAPQPYNSGEGGKYICANVMPASQCVEPLPDFPSGGLIGKIGNQIFGIGKGTTLLAEQLGTFYLRINDGDLGLYDNVGELVIDINVQR